MSHKFWNVLFWSACVAWVLTAILIGLAYFGYIDLGFSPRH